MTLGEFLMKRSLEDAITQTFVVSILQVHNIAYSRTSV